MGTVHVLQKIGVHIRAVVVAGPNAYNGKLFARRGNGTPIDAALIPGNIDPHLKQSHTKIPLPGLPAVQVYPTACYAGKEREVNLMKLLPAHSCGGAE